jgi:hypothetical protein
MTQTQDQPGPSDIERIVLVVGEMFKNIESRRDYGKTLHTELRALESCWSSVERNLLTMGRRRRAIEAPLPPLPEPRGAAATQNWLDQRRSSGTRAQDWVEGLPAALASLRSVEAIEAFGETYPAPVAEEKEVESLRDQMRSAILRQDMPSINSLQPRLQQCVTRDGQRRTDLTRIVESRMSIIVPALNAHVLADAGPVPELQRWQAETKTVTARMLDALSRWDVTSARESERDLNKLADAIPGIRTRIERELRELESAIAARQTAQDEREERRGKLKRELDAGNLLWRSIQASGQVTAALGIAGIAAGVTVDAVDKAWLGMTPLAPIALGIVGAAFGSVVGVRRLHARRLAVAAEAASVEKQLSNEGLVLADRKKHAEHLRGTLKWFVTT